MQQGLESLYSNVTVVAPKPVELLRIERVVLFFCDEYHFHELRLDKDLKQSIANIHHFDVRKDHYLIYLSLGIPKNCSLLNWRKFLEGKIYKILSD